MNQPIDYVFDREHRLISCHCRHGFICPNTSKPVDSHNRCRILVRHPPRVRYTWQMRLFLAGLVLAALGIGAGLVYLGL